MELWRFARARNWPIVCGYLLFVGMMAVGYLYNVTFIQLGLKDLGERVLTLPRPWVAQQMAVLALATCVIALVTGLCLQRYGTQLSLLNKLQVALVVVTVQTLLTAAAPRLGGPGAFTGWILICAFALGIGVPITFGLTTDLIPVADRGFVAAAITAIAYFLAAMFTTTWEVEALARQMLWLMGPGTVGLGAMVGAAMLGARVPLGGSVARFVGEVGWTRHDARFARGRFVAAAEPGSTGPDGRFWSFVGLMFGIFFIDSLGFLRIIDTPILVSQAWQSAELTPRLIIGLTHVAAAIVGGVLYTHLSERHLFYWIFTLFGITHFAYSIRVWLLPDTDSAALGMPVMYATAVSLYTVLNFAIWADFSTPRTIGRQAAIGVALSGWAATFISTALAIQWQANGMALDQHLRIVNALALLFLLILLPGAAARTRGSSR